MILFFGLTMNTKKKIKIVKHIDTDIHLKYLCPKKDCLTIHWLTISEVKTKNFKVVCYCGCVFKPKQISNIKVTYIDDHVVVDKPPSPAIIKKQVESQRKQQVVLQNKTCNSEKDFRFIQEAIETLLNFGYTREEATQLIQEQYDRTKTNNPAQLVKLAINFFGE